MPKGDNNRKLSDEQREQIIRRYTTPQADGTWVGATLLGREFGVTNTAIYAFLASKGIARRTTAEALAHGKACKPITNVPVGDAPLCKCGCGMETHWLRSKNRWAAFVSGHFLSRYDAFNNARWLRDQYVSRGRTLDEIAADCGVSATTVARWIRNHGMSVRDASSAHVGRQTGERNPAWKGGIAQWEYSSNWKVLARQIRYRDKWTCQDCGEQRQHWGNNLHVHHIDGDKLNNALANLVSLCALCHRQRHRSAA